MPGNFAIKIKGSEFAKVRKQFDRLIRNTQQKVVSQAVRSTMRPIVSAIKSRAPKGPSGMLRQSINLKMKSYRSNGFVVGIAGVSRISKKQDGEDIIPAKYAHLVEYGTESHGPKKKKAMYSKRFRRFFGGKVKGTKPRPFIRTTWDVSKSTMERSVRQKIGRGVERIAAQGLSL